MPPSPEALGAHWALDPAYACLNHGSFGACPTPVLVAQRALRDRLEAQPMRFLVYELEERLDEARRVLADFIGADPEGLAFVPNTTTGVATVLAACTFEPGDEIVTTDHVYPAVRAALARIVARSGARLVVAPVPFPIAGPEAVEAAVLAACGPRTRLAVLDHITSPTALVFPIERLVPALAARGIDTLVDGAHAPGQIALDVAAIGAAYYVGNCHKWLCSPKGAAFIAVREDRREGLLPLVASNGETSFRTDRSRFRLAFDWTGTDDPTPYLCVPVAIRFLAGLMPGGWPAIRARNHALALEARALLADALGIAPPAPASMLGAMAALPLGPDPDPRPSAFPYHYAVRERLWARGIEVPVFAFPAYPERVLRVSAFLYNELAQFQRLARELPAALAKAPPDEAGVN